ncbi:MAG: methylmalonyl-CoA epimerase [Flavobacteriaceae bacterium]
MDKIEHLGIAVKDLNQAISNYEMLLGTPCYKQEDVPSQGVRTAFFQSGPNKVELLAATDENSPIFKFLEKKGEGIHHVAFAVDDILKEMQRLKKEGYRLLSDHPSPGADGKLICFVHPKDSNGVLMELCQDI